MFWKETFSLMPQDDERYTSLISGEISDFSISFNFC